MNDNRRLFEARIAAGADSALIRFTLGRICAEEGEAGEAFQPGQPLLYGPFDERRQSSPAPAVTRMLSSVLSPRDRSRP